MSELHVPVLLQAVCDMLSCRGQALFVDATLGAGGHAKALLERNPDALLFGIDRDRTALAIARARLALFGTRVTIAQARFSAIGHAMKEQGLEYADRMLFDIGVSSMQLDTPERGFSHRFSTPLDMRMEDSGETALELMQRLSETELADTIYRYGEERLSRRISRAIKAAIERGSLATTADLRDICVRAYPKRRHRLDPATRTFQALRIAVNEEFGELEKALQALPGLLRPASRVAFITFHSIEDRIVKRTFLKWKEEKRAKLLTKKPVRADQQELALNARARSAKLRVIEWL